MKEFFWIWLIGWGSGALSWYFVLKLFGHKQVRLVEDGHWPPLPQPPPPPDRVT